MESFANLELSDPVVTLLVAVGALALLMGGGIGYWLARRRDPAATRIQVLEDALETERDLAEAYRASVSKHFDGTSDMFRDLTRQYAALYAHLAEGARELSEEVPELGRGYADPALQIGGSRAGLGPDATAEPAAPEASPEESADPLEERSE
jgi:uncharacterized membrane-anchored protein YhcB (DUF1043 family)